MLCIVDTTANLIKTLPKITYVRPHERTLAYKA